MAFDNNGLVPPRFNEIVTDIQNDQIATIATPFSYQSNNKIYQLNSVYARSADQLAQLIESAFNTLKLGSAEGIHLDEIGRLRSVFRIPAQPSSTSSQYAVLNAGSTIPSGTIFYSTTLKKRAYNPSLVTGSAESCTEATLQTNSVVEGATYGFTINGTPYTYVVQVADTIQDIHDALIVLLDADTGKAFTYTEQVSGSGRSFIFTADIGTLLSVTSVTVKMVVTTVKVYFYLETIETGEVVIAAGLMDSTKTPVVGIVETLNDEDFSVGRSLETDSELRVRIQAGPLSDCTGTPDTIVAALLTNVTGVTFASVIENLTDQPTDGDGRPWLSYETLVVGGADPDVAQEIWRTRGSAVATYGGITEAVTDSAGLEKFVSFSRPTAVDINVEVDYTLYSEETPPDLVASVVQTTVAEYISALPIGKDVIAGRIIGIIYQNVTGLQDVVVRIEDAASPGFTTGTIPISVTQYPLTDVGDVAINP